MKTPILGAAYEAASLNAAADRCVNLFPEVVPHGGKEPIFLRRCPGLRTVATIGSGPIRGAWVMNGKGYVVSGSELYEVDKDWSSIALGTVTAGASQVSMADNGKEVFIAAGGPSYIYSITTGALRRITDPDFPGANSVGFLDGYFVFTEPDSQRVWVTGLYNGSAIDALDFASAEAMPDKIVGMAIDHREVWLLGESSCEVWYNSGGADFPLARMQGAFVETGCAAARSVCKMDNAIIWLGSDARGKGIVFRSTGYSGQRISTHAIEDAIQHYPTIADAIGFSYHQSGHSFYVLTFPSANKTWVFDASTSLWHERSSLNNGESVAWRANCIMHFNGELIVGDNQNGNLYALDLRTYKEGSTEQRWVRAWRALPPRENRLNRILHHSLQVDIETGVGLNIGQGSDPVISLRWSDDGGHTWSNYHQQRMGKIGEYKYRVIWRRLGHSRDRVYEVSGSDPVPVSIIGAELAASPAS